jgi:hypothetical protein
MAKYFNKDTNETEEVPVEKWGWGIIYQPTEGAISVAERETIKRNEELKKERNRLLNEANKMGLLAVKRNEIHNWYIKETRLPVRPLMEELHQFDARGCFHRIAEIDQERIWMASLYQTSDMTKRIDIPWRPGMKFIHKYIKTRPAGETEFKKSYLFGYKYKGAEHLICILPDERILMIPDQEVDLVQLGV